MLRIPAVCNNDWSTTVLCHLREANIAGIAQKPNGLIAVIGCSKCHDAIDGRAPLDWYDDEDLTSWKLDALVRTLDYWHENGELSTNTRGELRWEDFR